jgi:ATP-dependent Lon protease
MVITRNQKRLYDQLNEEETEDQISDSINTEKKLKTNDNYSNIKLIKNRNFNITVKNEDEDNKQNNDKEYNTSINQSNIYNENLNFDFQHIITSMIGNFLQKYISKKKDDDSYSLESETENESENISEIESETGEKDEYLEFIKYAKSIYKGDFFERPLYETTKSKIKKIYSKEDIIKVNTELKRIKQIYDSSSPSIVDIIKNNTDIYQKQKLLENFYQYNNSDLLSSDYQTNLKILNKYKKGYNDPHLYDLEKQILEASNNINFSDNYREKILRSNMSFENKVIAYKRLDVMETFENTDTSEYAKYKNWMDILLSIPFGICYNIPVNINSSRDDLKMYIQLVRKTLDSELSFLERPKDQIINIVSQMIRNPECNINAIGLYGPKGVGKSSIALSIAKALDRPLRTISLGGESDGSMLTGHSFTYVGSCSGRIIEILRETKCNNPIILFDELDKVSEGTHGKEIIGNLIHLTDSTTNNKYNYDKYFAGLEFDLSKVLCIFTYNDSTKVDKILADRLFKIKIDNYSLNEKLEITKKHLVKTIVQKYKFTDNEIIFPNETINYIVESSRLDNGMRDIKRKIEIIVSRINTLLLTNYENDNTNDAIVKLKYKELYNYYTFDKLPINVLKQHVDIFLKDSITTEKDDDKFLEPPAGMYI